MSADRSIAYWATRHTANECDFELCSYCGCCAHGRTQAKGCPVDGAPRGMRCLNDLCGCEGRG